MTTQMSRASRPDHRPQGGPKTPAMRIGAQCGPRQGFPDGAPHGALEHVRARGYDGVLFATPRSVSPALDPAALADVRDHAEELDLYVEMGLGSLGPFGDAAERVNELYRLVEASVLAGCRQFFAYTRTERHHPTTAHADQLVAVQDTIAALVPRLRDEGLRLNLKTHEDLSSHEVLRLVEACGPDVVGVSLDVANLVVRGEDPVRATQRLAPHVHQTHLEDVVLYADERGLRRRLRPCGAGTLDWLAIVSTLFHEAPVDRLTLEQHQGQFGLEVFEAGWFDAEPHVTAAELADLFRQAFDAQRRAGRGELPELTDAAPVADPDDLWEQLDQSAQYLRGVLRTIEGGRSSW